MRKQINNIIILTLVCYLFGGLVNLSAQSNVNKDSVKVKTQKIKSLETSSYLTTASICKISNNDLIRNSVTNIGNALSGRLPGLNVDNNAGIPGADFPNLFVRGKNTYNVNSPLLLVDGFETDIQQLSLYEIDNITVLKDAASLAMYGQKGANGAIVVSTKRGTIGKTQINFNLYGGVQQLQNTPDLLNSYQYATLYNEALQNDGLVDSKYSQNVLDHFKNGDSPFMYPNNNFYNQLMNRSAVLSQGDLGISGGNKNLRYFVSLSYMKNNGFFKNTEINNGYSTQAKLDRYNFRANLDIAISEFISAKVNVGLQLDERNSPGTEISNIWSSMSAIPPVAFPMINPNGTIGGNQQYRNNPYGLITGTGYKTTIDRNISNSVNLTYKLDKLLKGLSVSAIGSISNWMETVDGHTKSFAVYELQQPTDSTYSYTKVGDDSKLNWVMNSGHNNRNSFETNIKYELAKSNHFLSAMLQYHYDKYLIRGTYIDQRNVGVSADVFYGYKTKYLARLTSGYYGSELFMPGKQYGLFPAASISWVASEEKFMKNALPFINKLKFSGSYGLTGSNTSFTGDGLYNRFFYEQFYIGAAGYRFGSSNTTNLGGETIGRMANPDITWDKSYKTDISAEMTIFNHVNFMFTYFFDRRTDILTLDGTLPQAMGISQRTPWTNGGEVLNQGYETTIDYFGSVGDFKYTIGAGLWFNRSKIISRNDQIIYADEYRSPNNKPIGQTFGLEAIGFYENDADVANYPKQMFGIVGAGDLIYKDQNGDDKIDNNDLKPIGYSGIPEYTYSLNLNLVYRNFDFSALCQGSANSSIMLNNYLRPFSTKGNAYSYAFNRWTPDNPSANYPKLSTVDNDNNYQPSTIWLRSGDFLKIRNLELGYKLPAKQLGNLGVENVRFFVRGMNLFTFSKIDFTDPENVIGFPSTKSVSIGVNVTL